MSDKVEQALLELLNEDDYGLWEVRSVLEDAGFDLVAIRNAAQRLVIDGTLEVSARTWRTGERQPLPSGLDLASSVAWASPHRDGESTLIWLASNA
ncbi:MAG: hypothetical protein H7287_06740 [Thermoleophilia bacterium]|nr:hypothetical protein [Thermoleophilia bacterium]